MMKITEDIINIMESTTPSIRNLTRRKTVLGVGVNDATFITSFTDSEGNKYIHPAYSDWNNMMKRCYSNFFQSNYPTYHGCKVNEDWFSFMSFYRFWQEYHVEGYQLDKDILWINNKEYSSKKCVYVPNHINSFFGEKTKDNGLPVGVHVFKRDNNYRACIRKNGKSYHVGYFAHPDDANRAWSVEKKSHLYSIKPELDEIDHRLYECMMIKIDSMTVK